MPYTESLTRSLQARALEAVNCRCSLWHRYTASFHLQENLKACKRVWCSYKDPKKLFLAHSMGESSWKHYRGVLPQIVSHSLSQPSEIWNLWQVTAINVQDIIPASFILKPLLSPSLQGGVSEMVLVLSIKNILRSTVSLKSLARHWATVGKD